MLAAMSSRFLTQIYSEHRSIAAVLHAMRSLVKEEQRTGKRADPAAFRAMLYYLDVFPEREHHPKEEQYLFSAVHAKTREADAALSALASDHEEGERAIRALEQALVRYEAGGAAEFEPFAQAVERYVADYFDHMRREEAEIMPVAERVLGTEDWQRIEAAFAAHRDPLAGTDTTDYRALFSRIVELAPAPIGLGTPLS